MSKHPVRTEPVHSMNVHKHGKDYPIGPFLYCSYECRKAGEKLAMAEDGVARVEMDYKVCKSGEGGCDWCGAPLVLSDQLRFTVLLSNEQTEHLKRISQSTGKSISVLIRQALCQQLKVAS